MSLFDSRAREFPDVAQWLEQRALEIVAEVNLSFDPVAVAQPEHVLPHMPHVDEARKAIVNHPPSLRSATAPSQASSWAESPSRPVAPSVDNALSGPSFAHVTFRDQIQATLGDGYVVEHELRGGGMSHVFVATEQALGRRIVVKVLPPDTVAQVAIDRFKREIPSRRTSRTCTRWNCRPLGSGRHR